MPVKYDKSVLSTQLEDRFGRVPHRSFRCAQGHLYFSSSEPLTCPLCGSPIAREETVRRAVPRSTGDEQAEKQARAAAGKVSPDLDTRTQPEVGKRQLGKPRAQKRAQGRAPKRAKE